MKSFMNLKSVMIALVLATCSLVAVGCDEEDDDVDPGQVMEGEYVGTLYVSMKSQNYFDTIQNATFTFANMGKCMVKAKTPAIKVSIQNPMATMTMDFGSFEIDSIPVNGIKDIAMTGNSLGEALYYQYVDSEVDYERNGKSSHTTVEGKINAAVTEKDILVNYSFTPGNMKASGLALDAAFIGSKK